MKTTLFYLLQVIIVSGILYGYYHFFLKNKKFHGYNRYFLLASTAVSILIPFLNIPVYFTQHENEPSTLLQTLTVISSSEFEETLNANNAISPLKDSFTASNTLLVVYLAIACIVLLRFIIALLKIKRLTTKYQTEKLEEITFINTNEHGTPFSFFRLLFWNRKIPLDTPTGQQIFRHELFHIRQKHSYDIIFIEMLSVIFWFNPFFHLVRKELKTIHEFLADQSAVNKNEEWNYAELLLMQVLGSPNNRLTNPFFHNQIKRRIAMITTSQKTNYQYLRKLLVLPVAAMLVALFAFKYKTKEANPNPVLFEKQLTVVIDAGHGGTAGAVAPDGTSESDINLVLAQKVKELNKNELIKIILTRDSKEEVELRKRSEFANAQNPDLFISIHLNVDGGANTQTGSSKSGFEVFISNKNSTFYGENKILGSILLNYFSNIYPIKNKIQYGDIWVLDNSKCPSVLVECGYLSNKKDLAFIKEKANQEKVAQSILQSIEQYAIQQEAPDFNERKKQVSDTIPMDIKIIKDANGKISGTFNGLEISGASMVQWSDQSGAISESMAIAWGKNNLTVINKETISLFEKKYGALWNELIKSLPPTGIAPKPAENNSATDKIFEKTEIEPSFPGGEGAWEKYLDRNLNREVGNTNKAPAGTYTVWIQFIVDKTGAITNVKALTKHGYGMEKEALTIIKKGPNWAPAIQNGKKVTAYKKQPVTFVVNQGNKSTSSVMELLYENDRVFEKVDIQASYPGGRYAFEDYIQKNLNTNVLIENKAPDNSYTVLVRFKVEQSGHVSDVKAITENGFGMEKEAISTVIKSGRWLPALIKDKTVTSYTVVPVHFSLPVGKTAVLLK